MPIYEYKCKCGSEREVKLPFTDSDTAQVCECGRVMQHKISLSSFTIKPTGRQNALDTLNTGCYPDGSKKKQVEQLVAAGLEQPPKSVW